VSHIVVSDNRYDVKWMHKMIRMSSAVSDSGQNVWRPVVPDARKVPEADA